MDKRGRVTKGPVVTNILFSPVYRGQPVVRAVCDKLAKSAETPVSTIDTNPGKVMIKAELKL